MTKLALYAPVSAGSYPEHRNIHPEFLADPITWAAKLGTFMDLRKIDDVVVDKPMGHDGTGNFGQLHWPPPDPIAWREVVRILNAGHRRLYVYLGYAPDWFWSEDVFGKALHLAEWLKHYAGCICIMDSAVVRWNKTRKTTDEMFRLCDAMLDGSLGIEHWDFAGGERLGSRVGLGTIEMLGPAQFRYIKKNPQTGLDEERGPNYTDPAAFDLRPGVRNFHLNNQMWNSRTGTYDRWKEPDTVAVWHWASRAGLTNLVERDAIEYWDVAGDNWSEKLATYDVYKEGAQEA